MMPVPTHLKGCVIPDSSAIDEGPLAAKVQCSCGGKTFHLLYIGQTHEYDGKPIPCVAEIKGKFFFLIKAIVIEEIHIFKLIIQSQIIIITF